jgi:hypothetical protein
MAPGGCLGCTEVYVGPVAFVPHGKVNLWESATPPPLIFHKHQTKPARAAAGAGLSRLSSFAGGCEAQPVVFFFNTE